MPCQTVTVNPPTKEQPGDGGQKPGDGGQPPAGGQFDPFEDLTTTQKIAIGAGAIGLGIMLSR